MAPLFCTLVAGSDDLAEALVGDPRLEAWLVQPADPHRLRQRPGQRLASSIADPTGYRLRAAIGANREYCPWNVTVTVSVGPLRCLARMKSASPLRADSGS